MIDENCNKASNEIVNLYRRRAANYNWTANLYYLIGFREWHQRKRAITSLCLQPGDTVVEIGCGTGLNFGLLQEKIGASGKIIGVDATDAMLAQAARTVEKHRWNNIDLILSDVQSFHFPKGVDGILSTYALSLISKADLVIEAAKKSLRTGGRLCILDFQVPPGAPLWVVRPLLSLVKPFGAGMEWLRRKPWESIQETMVELFPEVLKKSFYFRISYLLAGVKN
jgi:demethylmenaquinone methyltransferase/2-methoxy-6-polyprenyl-1,4-benzoquinol methylase